MSNIGYSLLKVKINKINNVVSELIYKAQKFVVGYFLNYIDLQIKYLIEKIFFVNTYYETIASQKV